MPSQEQIQRWCLDALKSTAGNQLSLDQLREVCNCHSGSPTVTVGDIAVALLSDTDWELVCRPSQARRLSGAVQLA